MTILEETLKEIAEEDRKAHKSVLKGLVETRDRLREKYYKADKEVNKLATMTTEEFHKWSMIRARHSYSD